MRQILVERRARGGAKAMGDLDRGVARRCWWRRRERKPMRPPLDEALRASKRAIRKARIIELRFFGGLSIEEAAAGWISRPRTLKRRWDARGGGLSASSARPLMTPHSVSAFPRDLRAALDRDRASAGPGARQGCRRSGPVRDEVIRLFDPSPPRRELPDGAVFERVSISC